jgi:hypothetical protein
MPDSFCREPRNKSGGLGFRVRMEETKADAQNMYFTRVRFRRQWFWQRRRIVQYSGTGEVLGVSKWGSITILF